MDQTPELWETQPSPEPQTSQIIPFQSPPEPSLSEDAVDNGFARLLKNLDK